MPVTDKESEETNPVIEKAGVEDEGVGLEPRKDLNETIDTEEESQEDENEDGEEEVFNEEEEVFGDLVMTTLHKKFKEKNGRDPTQDEVELWLQLFENLVIDVKKENEAE